MLNVWNPNNENTDYYEPSKSSFIMNFKIHNLEELLEVMKKEGVIVVGEIEDHEYRKF